MYIKRVGVVGSGTMGTGIAEVVTRAGYEVVWYSRSESRATEARARLAAALARDDATGLSSGEAGGPGGPTRPGSDGRARRHLAVKTALSRLASVTDLAAMATCQLVIEAVVENFQVKAGVMRELDRVCPERTIITSAASTLPVLTLALAAGRPDRVCGLHFFHPAPLTPFVEIMPAATTSDATAATVRRFAEACDKRPVLAADRAGAIVAALLFPFLNEAIRLSERGRATPNDIDAALRGSWGLPVGPFELLDQVGLDTTLAVLESLHAETGHDASRPAPLLEHLVTSNRLGRKTGQGFYAYPLDDRASPDAA